jgi:hypothetical protein
VNGHWLLLSGTGWDKIAEGIFPAIKPEIYRQENNRMEDDTS